jgi:cyanophycinase
MKPLYLLADSQLLFWSQHDQKFVTRIREDMNPERPTAAYIGASNGDDPQFYELFLAAMEGVGLPQCRMIPATPSSEDRQFLESAGLILLSGGDVQRGWHALQQNGLKETILQGRYDGAVLVGVSAGAVQLGLGALSESPQPQKLDLLRFAPFYVGAHEEQDEWWNLRALVRLAQSGDVRGIGIPGGGGALYYSDGSLEPIRKPLIEISKAGDELTEHLLLPAGLDSEDRLPLQSRRSEGH